MQLVRPSALHEKELSHIGEERVVGERLVACVWESLGGVGWVGGSWLQLMRVVVLLLCPVRRR